MSLFGLGVQEVFQYLNYSILPAWLFILLIPRHNLTKIVVKLSAILLCVDYLIFLVMTLTQKC